MKAMNNQDYEQKKRECWEEFVRTTDKILTPRDAFLFAFDRAYALGKVKDLISQKEIEKAAEDYVSFEKGGKCYPSYIVERACCCAFKDGANFALGKQEKDADTVIQGWVFVDETTFDRILCVRKVTQGDYEAVWDSGHPEFCLGAELFPDMIPNSLPDPVEIIIKRKKNG